LLTSFYRANIPTHARIHHDKVIYITMFSKSKTRMFSRNAF